MTCVILCHPEDNTDHDKCIPKQQPRIALSGNVPTFGELITRIQADASLSTARRSNLCSSLRRLALALDKDLDDVHAYPPTLLPLMKDLHPAQLGLTRKRWQNIRADVAFAIKHHSDATPAATRSQQINPSWQRLLDALPAWRDSASMSRFARWCSSLDIEPDDVEDDTLIAYDDALARGTLVQRPRGNVQMVARAWNRAADAVPIWPNRKITAPASGEALVLPEAALPSSFRVDLDRWCQHLEGNDILADDALDRPLRPASIASSRYLARYLHGALVRSGREPATTVGLVDLVQPTALRATLQFCLDRANGNITTHIGKLTATARQIAKHWAKLSAPEMAQVTSMTRKLIRQRAGMTEVNRQRLLQIDDPANRQALVHFPLTEMRRAIVEDDGTKSAALRAQKAVAVEILLMVPIRLSNLAALEIGRTLIRSKRPGSRKYTILLEADEVKNSVSLKFDLPEQSAELIDIYFYRFHRRIAGSNLYLFPGKSGHKAPRNLTTQISERLFKVLGLRIHVHLFRHIAAKLYLDTHPHAFELVRQLLGHKNLQTTMKFYAQFSRTAAARHYDEFVLSLRANGGQRGRP